MSHPFDQQFYFKKQPPDLKSEMEEWISNSKEMRHDLTWLFSIVSFLICLHVATVDHLSLITKILAPLLFAFIIMFFNFVMKINTISMEKELERYNEEMAAIDEEHERLMAKSKKYQNK